MTGIVRVLFLCVENSSLSIMAEALLNHYGRGAFRAQSAGSAPLYRIEPRAVETLRRHGVVPGQPFSKSWNDLADKPFDFVIALEERVADESWPLFPGKPRHMIWPIPDPRHSAQASGSEAAFESAFERLKEQIGLLVGTQAVAVPGGG